MSHPLYWVALQVALGIPSRKVTLLTDFFGDAEGVFAATEEELKRCPTLTKREITDILKRPYAQARAIWDECAASGIQILTPEDSAFPDGLRNIPDMPCVLYVKGCLPRFDLVPAISVVGTRKPTVYGKMVCHRMASVLATAGVTVVSGGALGIDSCSHLAAIEAKGKTVAVLGCGINSGYLRANGVLREQISRNGALVSEYPPSSPASRYTFPARNRLIAALSLGTVIIEAGEKSGSLITADMALEQGKDVFVVPGSVMSPDFHGSNRLISEGATAVFSGLDVLEAYKKDYFDRLQMNKAIALHKEHIKEQVVQVVPIAEPTEPQKPKEPTSTVKKQKKLPRPMGKDLSADAGLVYNTLLNAERMGLADLLACTQLDAPRVMRELTKLELDGCVTKDPDGCYHIVNSIEE